MSFAASYAGICDACEGPIVPGQLIRDATEAQRSAYTYEHVTCPEQPAPGKACPECFMVHAPQQKGCDW
jgi:hypothetical protein